jgi:hypothetical protein
MIWFEMEPAVSIPRTRILVCKIRGSKEGVTHSSKMDTI